MKFSDEKLAKELFSSCPALEDLNIKSCCSMNFEILDISASKLKRFTMYGCGGLDESTLKVSAPCLLSYKYIGYLVHDFCLELSSSDNAEIGFLASTAESYSPCLKQLFRSLADARAFTLWILCIKVCSLSVSPS